MVVTEDTVHSTSEAARKFFTRYEEVSQSGVWLVGQNDLGFVTM